MFTARVLTAIAVGRRRPPSAGIVLPAPSQPNVRRFNPAWHQTAVALVLIVALTAGLCLYVYQAAQINAAGQEMVGLRAEYGRLQRENSNLLAIYAAEQSLARMMPRAAAAGFGPAAEVRYVSVVPTVGAEAVVRPSELTHPKQR